MIADTDQMTFEKMIELKHSTRMELADRILPDLLSAAQGKASVSAAIAVLEKWDRTADNDSRGGVLFADGSGNVALSNSIDGPNVGIVLGPNANRLGVGAAQLGAMEGRVGESISLDFTGPSAFIWAMRPLGGDT